MSKIECKSCGELVDEIDYNSELGLCYYCDELIQEAEIESRYKQDSSRREAEERGK